MSGTMIFYSYSKAKIKFSYSNTSLRFARYFINSSVMKLILKIQILSFVFILNGKLLSQNQIFNRNDAYLTLYHSLFQELVIKSDSLGLDEQDIKSFGISYGNHYKRFIFFSELFFRSPVNSNLEKYFSWNIISGGLILRDRKRIQFPLLINLGYEAHTLDQTRRGGFKTGAQLGINIFFRRNLYISCMLEHNRSSFVTAGSNDTGLLQNNSIRIGLGKHLIKY